MLGGWPKGRELWDGVTSGDQGLGGRPRPSCRLGTCLRRFPERKLKAAVCCPSSNSSSVPCPCAPSTGAPRGISISDPISLVPSAQLIQILAHPIALWSLGGRRDAEAVKSRVCLLHPQLTQLDTWSCLLPAVSSPASVMSVFLPSQAFLSVPPMGSIKPGLSLGRTVQEDPEMPDDTATPCSLSPCRLPALPTPYPACWVCLRSLAPNSSGEPRLFKRSSSGAVSSLSDPCCVCSSPSSSPLPLTASAETSGLFGTQLVLPPQSPALWGDCSALVGRTHSGTHRMWGAVFFTEVP